MKLKDLFKEKEHSAGPYETLVMTAIELLGKNAYSLEIQEKIEQMTGKTQNLGKIYVTLERMEMKGYLAARTDESNSHPRRYFRLLQPGAAALHASMSTSRRAIEELDELGFFKLWKRKRI